MAEFDILSIIVPSLIAGIISFVLIGVKQLGKTSEGTLTGTIKLEHVSAGLESLEDRINSNFDKMERLITETRKEIIELRSIVSLNTYRLDRLERNGGLQK